MILNIINKIKQYKIFIGIIMFFLSFNYFQYSQNLRIKRTNEQYVLMAKVFQKEVNKKKLTTIVKYINEKYNLSDNSKLSGNFTIIKSIDGTETTIVTNGTLENAIKKESIKSTTEDTKESEAIVSIEKPVIISQLQNSNPFLNFAGLYNIENKSLKLGAGINIDKFSGTVYFFELQNLKLQIQEVQLMYRILNF